MIRAKFCVTGKEPVNDGVRIKLKAVYDGSPENEAFFKLTPAGDISLAVVSEETADNFSFGDEFYVDFTKVIPEAKE